MTLVVGMHLGDSVGVVADSRTTVRYRDGRTRYLDNALKVYAFPPYFIAAVAGDAFAGTGFLNSLLLRLITVCSLDEFFGAATDLSQMREHILQTYHSDLQNNLLNKDQRFACVIGTENLVRVSELGETPRLATLPPSISDASFESSAAQMARPGREDDRLRTIFSVRFPEGRIEQARTGQVIYIGSGSVAAKRLSHRTTVLFPPSDMSHGDRLAAAAVDVSTAQELSGDPSFNGIYFGISLSCGAFATILHGFDSWPSDPVSKNEYAWEDYHSEDIPKLTPFSAGLDVAELNTGWIYDAGARKRMKLQSFLEPEFIDANLLKRSRSAQWLF